MPDWRMKGAYLKNCNCVPSCPLRGVRLSSRRTPDALVRVVFSEGARMNTTAGGQRAPLSWGQLGCDRRRPRSPP
jgi:hypothetical protein